MDQHDELAEIDGVKPNAYLKDGEEREAKSMTSSSVYTIKRTGDHYYCKCPAWRNQGRVPVNARSCKHLRALLGDAYEAARCRLKNPHGAQSGASPSKSSRGKRRRDDDDDDDDAADNSGKRAKGSSGKTVANAKVKVEVLLAVKWDLVAGTDPAGWWISEKLDGVRAFYDGTGNTKSMYSRLGNPFTPPKWFLDALPKGLTLDGELFGGRGRFQETTSIVKTVSSPCWKNITFEVFDIPSMGDRPFEERIAYLKKLFPATADTIVQRVAEISSSNIKMSSTEKFTPKKAEAQRRNFVHVVEHQVALGRQHVLDELKKFESLGGEGVMLRQPGSLYEPRRSSTLMKVKTFYDAEAVVIGYEKGKGKYKGATGALKCRMETGKTFSVGTGLSDKQRFHPPEIGAIITYRFQELTRDGVPRFPSFVGVAVDKDRPSDATIPPHRRVNLSDGRTNGAG